jgi:putative transposase
MARQLRVEFPDALYHVTSRGNEQRDIFRDDLDRRMFLTFLGQAVERFGWSLTAWVLMSNHFHLIIQTPEPNLSRGMHWLNGTYVSWFNRRYARSGHLFGGRFKSCLIAKETHLRRALRYVVLICVEKSRCIPHLAIFRYRIQSTDSVEQPSWQAHEEHIVDRPRCGVLVFPGNPYSRLVAEGVA